jgi:hypothetical protein
MEKVVTTFELRNTSLTNKSAVALLLAACAVEGRRPLRPISASHSVNWIMGEFPKHTLMLRPQHVREHLTEAR